MLLFLPLPRCCHPADVYGSPSCHSEAAQAFRVHLSSREKLEGQQQKIRAETGPGIRFFMAWQWKKCFKKKIHAYSRIEAAKLHPVALVRAMNHRVNLDWCHSPPQLSFSLVQKLVGYFSEKAIRKKSLLDPAIQWRKA